MSLGLFLSLAALLGSFGLIAAWFLYEWIYRFAERTAQDVIPYLQKIDLAEVRSLFDPEQEKFLKLNLSLREFAKTQWKRCRLAQQYARNLAHNARVIQEWSKFERSRSRKTMNTMVRRSSLELNIICAQCRICSVVVRLQLHWWLLKMALLPMIAPPSFQALISKGSLEMVSFYEKMRKTAVSVGRIYGESYSDRLEQSV
jgi:hypothetical protein